MRPKRKLKGFRPTWVGFFPDIFVLFPLLNIFYLWLSCSFVCFFELKQIPLHQAASEPFSMLRFVRFFPFFGRFILLQIFNFLLLHKSTLLRCLTNTMSGWSVSVGTTSHVVPREREKKIVIFWCAIQCLAREKYMLTANELIRAANERSKGARNFYWIYRIWACLWLLNSLALSFFLSLSLSPSLSFSLSSSPNGTVTARNGSRFSFDLSKTNNNHNMLALFIRLWNISLLFIFLQAVSAWNLIS